MKIIVGLGNPGIRYQRTRHNIGFQVVDRFAETNHITISTKRFKSLYGTGRVDTEKVILVKPMTFMNRSGEAVGNTINFFHVGIEDLIVVHDDLDLSLGRLRFKRRGGDGGHQGVRSIIESTGENIFLRLKVGIGRPPQGMDPAEFVLTSFDGTQQSQLGGILSRAAESLQVVLLKGVEAAMNQYQKRTNSKNGI